MWERIQTTFLQAVDRTMQAVARLLPGLLVMLVLLLLTAAAAALASALTRRICTRLGLDRRLREWGMAAPAQADQMGPTRMVARVVAWAIVATGFLVGLSVFESTATSSLALRLLDYVPRTLVALLILAAGVAGSRALERSVLIGAVNMGLHSARLIGLGARWLLLILSSAMALDHLGIGGAIVPTAFAILFGGIVLSLALAIGLGAKDLVARSLERRLGDQGARPDAPANDKLHHL
jgi:hypothetical protein